MKKETQIVKSDLPSAVGFTESRPKLNPSQYGIYKLLKDKMKSGEIITFDDISKLYIKIIKGGQETYQRYKWRTKDGYLCIDNYFHKEGKWELQKPERYDADYAYKGKVKTWFQRNLGAAIMKGKILAIPIIDVE